MIVIYMAHPYGGNQENLEKAKKWLRWLNDSIEKAVFIAPWIAECEGVEETAENRAAGLIRMRAVIRACEAIIAISDISPGVRQELDFAPLGHRWFFPGTEIPETGDDFLGGIVEVGRVTLATCVDGKLHVWRLTDGHAKQVKA